MIMARFANCILLLFALLVAQVVVKASSNFKLVTKIISFPFKAALGITVLAKDGLYGSLDVIENLSA